MYYYYDAESGRYQFHSRIEVSAGQAPEEGAEDHKASLKKGKKWKTAGEKSLRKDDKVGDLTSQRMQQHTITVLNTAGCVCYTS